MNTFKRKWNHKSVEDWGSTMSDEANKFVEDFTKMLERQLGKEGVNIEIEPNHYDLYGFVEKDGKYIYVSYEIPRGGYTIDFSVSGCADGVLYRAADNNHDYKGYSNNFSSIQDLPRKIMEMFDNYERYARGRI